MTGDETNKCDHGKGENIHPPIYWNPFNKVFQCHKCGQVFVPEIKDPVERNTGKWPIPELPTVDVRDILNNINDLKPEDATVLIRAFKQQQDQIASLESSLEGMKKRNAELESKLKNYNRLIGSPLRGPLCIHCDHWHELAVRLKTAEGTLEAVLDAIEFSGRSIDDIRWNKPINNAKKLLKERP